MSLIYGRNQFSLNLKAIILRIINDTFIYKINIIHCNTIFIKLSKLFFVIS